MTRRIQRFLAAVSALGVLALGGAVFAQAQSTPAPAHERTSGPDLDHIQSGDQTTPDKSTKKGGLTADPAGGGTGQSGSQTAPDTGSVSETAGETSSETGPSDGPGGHADPVGATVDHQFSGVE
jgi:hypothetical protein